ncbi:MAG: polynucleotide kinase [Spirochaetia bacterium]|nr:polynucleotide kinase [Spirochaetia bacterium]
MKRLIYTKGLSGSGKSTWAKKYIKENKNVKRINKDDLRDMLDDGIWSKTNEKTIISIRNAIIVKLLNDGFDVIVDDTNLCPKHWKTFEELALMCEADLICKDFTDVDINVCIERDMLRDKKVGKKVIIEQWAKYLYSPPSYNIYNIQLPDCIIVDIDGTLAHRVNRSPFDYDNVEDDICDYAIKDIVNNYYNMGKKVYIFSGRDNICQEATKRWLDKHKILYHELKMREHKDNRNDTIIKEEMYNEIKDDYNVLFVIDDRPRVINMWKNLGLKVLNVGDNIDF